MKTNARIARVISGILFLSFISLVSCAQGRGGSQMSPDEMAKKQTENMISKLSLDDTQASQVTEINMKYAEQMNGLKDLDRSERKTQMESLRTSQDAELKGVLTEDQYATFQEMQANSKEQGGGNKRGGGRR